MTALMRMVRGTQMVTRSTGMPMELGRPLMVLAPSEETSSMASTTAATVLTRRQGGSMPERTTSLEKCISLCRHALTY